MTPGLRGTWRLRVVLFDGSELDDNDRQIICEGIIDGDNAGQITWTQDEPEDRDGI